MVKLLITAAEINNIKVVNSSSCLTHNDDKALMALKLSNSGIKTATSWISSARSPFQYVLDNNPNLHKDKIIIGKTSGFTAGGVGIQPLQPEIDYIAPFLWSSRSDSRPKVIQSYISNTKKNRNVVVRTYIVGGKIIGAYYTEGEGIVNCAGLSRNSISGPYKLSREQKTSLVKTAEVVDSLGFCRIDSTDEAVPTIYEVNPLARIDAESHGFNIALKILEYMLDLANLSYENINSNV